MVFSDDSDFISLYAATRDEPGTPLHEGKFPFRWVVADREGSVSSTLKQFFPPEKLHVVSVSGRTQAEEVREQSSPQTTESPPMAPETTGTLVEMAWAIVQDIDVEISKSTECQGIIRECWPPTPWHRRAGPPMVPSSRCQGRRQNMLVGRSKTVSPGRNCPVKMPSPIVQEKCPFSRL